LVLELAPAQTSNQASVRFAQYALAMNDAATAVSLLNASLASDPRDVPALIALARLQQADSTLGSYRATLQRVDARGAARDSLALEDDINLATVYAIAGDSSRARTVLTRALQRADERAIRRLPWDYTAANLIVLARQLGLRDVRPELLDLAYQLLDPAVQAQLR
jgi:tetratricopeptide (TPR) repeat protein